MREKTTKIMKSLLHGGIARMAYCMAALLAALLLPTNAMADDEAWVEYDSSAKTLTFKYGTKPASVSSTTTLFELNEDTHDPKWINNTEVTTVVFDPSFDAARPTACYEWFRGLSNLTEIRGMEYLHTDSVTSMSYMFHTCSKLTSVDLSHFNTEKVTKMPGMFNSCTSLTTLDLSTFNTAKVTTMGTMFAKCSNLTTIYVSGAFVTSGLTGDNFYNWGMFQECTSLVGAAKFDANNTGTTMANYRTGYFTLTPKATAYAELDLDSQTLTFKYDLKPESSDAVTVYDLNEGQNDPEWSSIAINVTSVVFTESFANARPTTCYKWFNEMNSLGKIEGLGNLNTADVTDMSFMFSGCTLESLDLSSFNTANVTNMSNMFSNCMELTTIYVGDYFATSAVTESEGMFEESVYLVGAAKYDENNTGASMANYKTGYFKTYCRVGDTKYDLCGETPSVDNLVLEDGKDFVAHAPFTANKVSYSRTMAGNYGTLCLPLEVNAASETGCKFYSLESVTDNLITLTQLEGTIAAGTPVFVYSDKGLNITASNAAVVTAPAEGTQVSGWQLVGSFTETTVPNDGYIISKNKFWLTSDLKKNGKATAVKTKGLRAWLKAGSEGSEARATSLSIFAEDDMDEETAIDAVEALTEGTAEIYDVQGRRTDRLQKGLNIVKTNSVTKKIMVK